MENLTDISEPQVRQIWAKWSRNSIFHLFIELQWEKLFFSHWNWINRWNWMGSCYIDRLNSVLVTRLV